MGGSKKKAQKPIAKAGRKLPSSFKCPFCSRADSVNVVMMRTVLVGSLRCGSCGVDFKTRITALSQPVDVYADWIDACNALAASKKVGK